MFRKFRILALLTALGIFMGIFSVLPARAATSFSIDIGSLSASAEAIAATIESGIKAGHQDADGVYYSVNYPATVKVDVYDIGAEDFVLLAARAISGLGKGQTATASVESEDVSVIEYTCHNGIGTELNMAQYLELADRVDRYGSAMGKLPSNFNRPTDGVNVYDGRMTLYSIGHLFARILSAYRSAKSLPATASFLPVHFGEVEVVPTEPAPTVPEDWFAAVIDASVEVKANMVERNVLPGTIYVGPVAVTPAQYVYLASTVVYALSNGQTSGELTVPTLNEPQNPQGSLTGRIYKYDYPDMARRTAKFCDENGQPPNYTSSSDLGAIHYYAVIQTMARVLAFYKSDGVLPNYITLTNFTGTVTEVAPPTTAPTAPPTTVTESSTVPGSSYEPVSGDWYTDVISAAIAVEAYVKDHGILPEVITVGANKCSYAQFTYIACQVILNVNEGRTSGDLSIPTTKEPANPSETLKAGTLQKTELLDLAARSIKFMDNNGGLAANYMITSLGNMHHHGATYMYARMLSYFAQNSKLPDSLNVVPWAQTVASVPGEATFGNNFSAYSRFLVPTTRCPSTNSTIIAVAKTAMYYSSGADGGFVNPKSTYEAMFNLMEYINDKTDYEFYMNSSRGALGVWSDKKGNCCDMAHLVNACARSLGVPGRYEHWNCTFSSSTIGHIFAALYCPDAPNPNINKENGWLYADPVNNPNYLGYQNHRNNFEYGDSEMADLTY